MVNVEAWAFGTVFQWHTSTTKEYPQKWPSGLRRYVQVVVFTGAWVRTPPSATFMWCTDVSTTFSRCLQTNLVLAHFGPHNSHSLQNCAKYTTAEIPERSKGLDLRSNAVASWVQTPLSAQLLLPRLSFNGAHSSVAAPLHQQVPGSNPGAL